MRRPAPLALSVALVLAACGAGAPGPGAPGADASVAADTGADQPGLDAGAPDSAAGPDRTTPILFVHGINGSEADFAAMIDRLVADGWSRERLVAHTFEDPSWGCNVDNAAELAGWVTELRAATDSDRVHLVAHSMGTLSSRYYLKSLGGTSSVDLYVTLGGMHHGLASACSPDFPFKPCIWDEICATDEFIAALNAAPATPGDFPWVSIYGTADTAVPNESSILDGAENIAVEGVDHMGLLEGQAAYDVFTGVLP